MTLRDTAARKVREVIQALAEGRLEQWMVADARAVLPALQERQPVAKTPVASVAHHNRVRRVEEARETAAMRAARFSVWAWNIRNNRVEVRGWGSRPACDCGCGRDFASDEDGQFDHWIERSQGGPDTRENGWRLHPDCHDQKTANRPSRHEWNTRRQRYCLRAGIPFVERRVR